MIYEVKGLSFSYGGNAPVLKDASFDLKEGEILTVLGRNGAGKSTLFSCMLGLLQGYEGEILLKGRDLKTLKEKEIAASCSFVPQNHMLSFGFSVIDYVILGCAHSIGLFSHPGEKEKEAAIKALKTLGIEDFASRPCTELSGGEMQQVTIARAIAAGPEAILFDEPTAHLDFSNQSKVLKVIKDLSKKGYTIAVTTHDPNHAILLGGNVLLFGKDGKIEKGTAEEMVTMEKLSSIYGSDIQIKYSEEFGRKICTYTDID